MKSKKHEIKEKEEFLVGSMIENLKFQELKQRVISNFYLELKNSPEDEMEVVQLTVNSKLQVAEVLDILGDGKVRYLKISKLS